MPKKAKNHGVLPQTRRPWRVVQATKKALLNGMIGQYAAGVAYFGTLSFFPFMAALVAIASLTLSSAQVAATINDIGNYIPKDIASLLATQLHYASTHQQANIAVIVVALGLSIFGVSGAMDSLIRSITAMYGIKDTRSFFKQKIISRVLTICFIGGMAVLLPLVSISTSMLTAWGASTHLVAVASVLRWVVLIAIAMIGIGVLYHIAKPGRQAWRWVSWGSIIATVMWLMITAAFFIYLQYFSNFSNSYSFFAGIIALMIWFNFGAFSVLIGASVDHDLAQ